MKRLFFRILLGVITLTSLLSSVWAESLHTIRIGVPDQSAGSKPFIEGPVGMAYIRHQLEDAFTPQGITIQWQFFKGAGPAVNEALANQQLDFAYLGDLAAIIGKAGGLPTRLLLGSRGSESWLAATRASGIKQLSDLKGKRVAVYRGTADQLAFDRALRHAGLSERDLRVINLDWAAGKAALAAGRIDAAWGGISLLALQGDKIDIIARSGDFGRDNTTQAAFLGTQHFIDTWPKETQQIIDILVANAAEISEPYNRQHWAQEMAAQSQIPAILFLEKLRPADLNFMTSPRPDPFLISNLDSSITQAQAGHLIRTPFSASQWADGRFVEQALATQQQAHWPSYDAHGQPQTAH